MYKKECDHDYRYLENRIEETPRDDGSIKHQTTYIYECKKCLKKYDCKIIIFKLGENIIKN